MLKSIVVIVGVVAGCLFGVVSCVTLDSWFSPPGTVFGVRDELGVGHEIWPIITGVFAAIAGGFVNYILWNNRDKPLA